MKKSALLFMVLTVIISFSFIRADNHTFLQLNSMSPAFIYDNSFIDTEPGILSISKLKSMNTPNRPLDDGQEHFSVRENNQFKQTPININSEQVPEKAGIDFKKSVLLQKLTVEKQGKLFHFPELSAQNENGLLIINKAEYPQIFAELWTEKISGSLPGLKQVSEGVQNKIVYSISGKSDDMLKSVELPKEEIIYSNAFSHSLKLSGISEIILNAEKNQEFQNTPANQTIIYSIEENQENLLLKSSTINPPAEEQIVYKESSASTCQQFAAELSNLVSPSCGYFTPGYSENGSFRILVTNADGCAGTYTIKATPVEDSAPDGSTPPSTTIVAYINFGEGEFLFSNAGVGRYAVEVTNTNAACQPIKNPVTFYVDIPDAEVSEDCDIPNPYQFTVSETVNSPSCPFESLAYSRDGSFTIHVSDGSGCTGTYTISAIPVTASAPDGSTPPPTTIIKYIGFGQGNFSFTNAGVGQYEVEVEQTAGNCASVRNKITRIITIEDGLPSEDCNIPNPYQFVVNETVNSPSCPFESPAYARDGSFIINVSDGSGCTGTYTISATPVTASAPDGSTPPPTTIIKYIGFGQGNFSFTNAGVGQYEVEVEQTAGNCASVQNKITRTITIEDGLPSEDCDIPNPYQFVVNETVNSPSCPFESPAYARDGSFIINVSDGSGCTGTYTISATPVTASAPDGSTPPQTTIIKYIGFGQGNFSFTNAGVGQYEVEVEQTAGNCASVGNKITRIVTIEDGLPSEDCDIPNPSQFVVNETVNSPSCPFESPAYARDGSFIINVSDGSGCTGTYTISATPVTASAPDGSTPPPTVIIKYIGFGEGNFSFTNAGVGQYEVEVEQTAGNCASVRNKITRIITIEDGLPSEDCDIPNPGQFTAEVIEIKGVECPSDNIAYAYNGSFVIKVINGANCSSELTTYTVTATPVDGTGPEGTTPPNTSIIKYIGFGQGNFNFFNAGVGQYEVEVENTAGSCSQVKKIEKFIVTVPDALPAQMDDVEDMVVCPGIATEPVVFSSDAPETLFKWTNDTPSIGLPASGTGDVPSFVPQNPGNVYIVATIEVTPYFENDGCDCNGEPVTFTITVDDNIAPEITGLSATPQVLNPPNHKMRDVYLDYNISDLSISTVTVEVSVSSNEPENGTGDGDTSPDWEIIDNQHVRLRAERSGKGDGRIYTVTITATDECGNTSSESVPVVVAHNITGPVSGKAFKVGSTVNFTGTFWDKQENSHTANWIFDDKTTVKGFVNPPWGMSNGTVTGSYKFTSTGIYKVRMNITDQEGLKTYSTMNGDVEEIVVVYDPNGGYSFGGGWFYSERGALVAKPEYEGKVSFGFTCTYFKNATRPKGETQFEFKAGDFEFNALNFDYLSISGNKAQFKGSGKITGGPSGVAFIMTVIDGDLPGGDGVDRIRMKIYNKKKGMVIYDNQPGSGDATNPYQELGTDSEIEIVNPFKSGILSDFQNNDSDNEKLDFGVLVYPNPTSEFFTVLIQGASAGEKVKISVYDITGKIIESLNMYPGNTFNIGNNYIPGTYILRAVQNNNYQQHVIIKQR
jgi:predicted RNA-binding protein with TRAM domain